MEAHLKININGIGFSIFFTTKGNEMENWLGTQISAVYFPFGSLSFKNKD